MKADREEKKRKERFHLAKTARWLRDLATLEMTEPGKAR
jgi:hypothetical protein